MHSWTISYLSIGTLLSFGAVHSCDHPAFMALPLAWNYTNAGGCDFKPAWHRALLSATHDKHTRSVTVVTSRRGRTQAPPVLLGSIVGVMIVPLAFDEQHAAM